MTTEVDRYWRKEVIRITQAPRSPMSTSAHAVRVGPLVFVTGQTGREPGQAECEGDVVQQTRQIVKNIAAILDETGSSLEHVIKRTVYIKRAADRSAASRTVDECFPSPCASTTLRTGLFAPGALIEIEVIAVVPERRNGP